MDYIKIGFDIIIGNPPYIKEYINQKVLDDLKHLNYYHTKMDIWYFFCLFRIRYFKR